MWFLIKMYMLMGLMYVFRFTAFVIASPVLFAISMGLVLLEGPEIINDIKQRIERHREKRAQEIKKKILNPVEEFARAQEDLDPASRKIIADNYWDLIQEWYPTSKIEETKDT